MGDFLKKNKKKWAIKDLESFLNKSALTSPSERSHFQTQVVINNQKTKPFIYIYMYIYIYVCMYVYVCVCVCISYNSLFSLN